MIVLDRLTELYGACAIADAIKRGEISAVSVIESRLDRIKRLDPLLNCFTSVLEDRALEMAAKVDALVAAGRDPGPLAGVPFGVKDNYDVVGRVTLAGSIINRSRAAARADAVIAQRAAKAGAVLIGTQNMDEFAYGFTTENAHYGATHNPRDTMRSAGGSSGGSAAAVAAGLTEFSLGTDTNGSIRVPSSFCGIFGLKPTFGRLPRTGTFPFVHDLDHLGPFARGVRDLATIYDALQGHDPHDVACAERPVELTTPLIDEGCAGLRVATLGGWFDDMADAQGRDAVRRVAELLGAKRSVSLPGTQQARAAAFVLTATSGGNLHREALRARAADFDPATRDRLLAGLLMPADAVLQAQRVRQVYRTEVLSAFRDHDILLAPATPCAAVLLGQPTISVNGADVPTRANIGLLTQPLSFIGLPIVTVPVINGVMPIGVQIIAAPWREDVALAAALMVERAGLASAPVAEPC
jgi:AtzE family amidohydrolase